MDFEYYILTLQVDIEYYILKFSLDIEYKILTFREGGSETWT